jgi:hypothetical protein
MKKLLGIAALILAFSPFAQAQGLPGHPDARNDRHVEMFREPAHRPHAAVKKHKRHMKHKHHMKHRRMMHHK